MQLPIYSNSVWENQQMSVTYSIYHSFNTLTNQSYIGFDKRWPDRKNDHLCASFRKFSKSYWYQFPIALREYGCDVFEWEVLYQSLDGEHCLKVMEPHFIKKYNSYYKWENGGYNMTLGGEGRLGCIPWNKGLTKETDGRVKGNPGALNAMFGKENPRTKDWSFVTPSGDRIYFRDLKQFCRENNLSDSAMIWVSQGKRNHHKGYTI